MKTIITNNNMYIYAQLLKITSGADMQITLLQGDNADKALKYYEQDDFPFVVDMNDDILDDMLNTDLED